MDVTFSEERITRLIKYIRDFLNQKANLEVKIRNQEATETDIAKEVFLERYCTGVFVMLSIFDMKFTIDERQLDFDIDRSSYKKITGVEENTKEAIIKLRNETIERYNEYLQSVEINKFSNALKMNVCFYQLLGMLTVCNKLNIDFDIRKAWENNIDDKNDKSSFMTFKKEMNDDLSFEMTSYRDFEIQINEITSKLFEKTAILRNFKEIKWERERIEITGELLVISKESYFPEEYEEKTKYVRRRQTEISTEINKLKTLYEKNTIEKKEIIDNFMKKYYL